MMLNCTIYRANFMVCESYINKVVNQKRKKKEPKFKKVGDILDIE